jgi:DNA-binding HxlR family transcriptional regulator
MHSAALDRALGALGDRWSLQVIRALLAGPQRFNDLAAALGVAPNILTARLRHLESAGLLVAEPYQERPRRFAYRLTLDGRELADVLSVLESWAQRRSGSTADAPTHEVCGTPVQWRAWCPTCDTPADTQAIWV